jgi:ribosomal protein S18 acetylase RimI-like enzyme
VIVPAAEMTFRLLSGAEAAADAADVHALHADVYASGPDGRYAADARFADRFRVQLRQPGFVLAEARSGGYLVGCAAGMPLRPSTSWWRDLTGSLPEQMTAEYPGRTFALTELIVRASWRRQGIGRYLHDLIIGSRREERATLVVPPAAAAAQAAFQNWGWRRVARTAGPGSDSPAADVLVADLPLNH